MTIAKHFYKEVRYMALFFSVQDLLAFFRENRNGLTGALKMEDRKKAGLDFEGLEALA